jgi:hypothetical protein
MRVTSAVPIVAAMPVVTAMPVAAPVPIASTVRAATAHAATVPSAATAAHAAPMLRACHPNAADQQCCHGQNYCKSFHDLPSCFALLRLDLLRQVRPDAPFSTYNTPGTLICRNLHNARHRAEVNNLDPLKHPSGNPHRLALPDLLK